MVKITILMENALTWWNSQPIRKWILINSIPSDIFYSIWAKIERKGILLYDTGEKFMIVDRHPKLVQFFKDGIYIEKDNYPKVVVRDDGVEYNSMTKAAVQTHTSRQNIRRATESGCKAGGFYWELKTKYN